MQTNPSTPGTRITSILLAAFLVLTMLPMGPNLNLVTYGQSSSGDMATLADSAKSTVTVHVTQNNTPKSYVHVIMFRADQSSWQESEETDSEGMATFSLETGKSYFVQIYGDGRTYRPYDGRKENQIFTAGETTNVTVELQEGYTLTTKVTLNGEPIADVPVYLTPSTGNRPSMSDENGIATFYMVDELDIASFRVQATDKYAYYFGADIGKTFAVTGDNLEVEGPLIELQPRGYITTRVTDGGAPVPNVPVYLNYYENGERYERPYDNPQYTDSDGYVSFPADSAWYFFSIYEYFPYPITYRYYGVEDAFQFPGNVPEIQLDAPHSVEATLKLNGSPYLGTQSVIIRRHYTDKITGEQLSRQFGRADSQNGSVRFENLPDGTYYMTLYDNNEFSYYDGKEQGQLITLPGTGRLDINLTSGESVQTTVTYKGNPMEDVDVYLVQVDDKGETLQSYGVETDANGVATFHQVKPGNNFYFTAASYFSQDDSEWYDGSIYGHYFSIPGNIPNIELRPAKNITTNLYLEGEPFTDNSWVSLWIIDQNGEHKEYAEEKAKFGPNYLFASFWTAEFDTAYFTVKANQTHASYNGFHEGITFSTFGQIPDINLSRGYDVDARVFLNGSPLSNTEVHLITEREQFSDRTMWNGRAGFYNVSPSAQAYHLIDRVEGKHAQYNGLIQGQTFPVPGKEQTIHLTEGHTLSLQLTYRGQPVQANEILLYQAWPDDGSKDHRIARLTNQSAAAISNLAAGSNYYINATYGSVNYSGRGTAYFTISADQSLTIELDPTYNPGYGNGGGGGGSGSKGGGGGGGGGGGDRSVNATTPDAPKNTPVNVTTTQATAAGKKAAEAAKAAGSATATAVLQNPGTLSAQALTALQQAAGMSLRLQADSLDKDNKTVEVRLLLDGAAASTYLAAGNSLNLSAGVSSTQALKTSALFHKWFRNPLAVVSLGHNGTYGQVINVAAKVDLGGADTHNLHFYRYDRITNKYNAFSTAYRIDANGYIHFQTGNGGDIIISVGELGK